MNFILSRDVIQSSLLGMTSTVFHLLPKVIPTTIILSTETLSPMLSEVIPGVMMRKKRMKAILSLPLVLVPNVAEQLLNQQGVNQHVVVRAVAVKTILLKC